MNNKSKWLSELNAIVKENDNMYRNAAKVLGLSDSSFWILYTIRDSEEGITQSDIVNMNFLPVQTINSALKKLEKDGYVELRYGSDKRKKQVYFTPKGEQLANSTVDRVIASELNALDCLSEQEQAEFLSIFRKYTSHLQQMLTDMESKGISNE